MEKYRLFTKVHDTNQQKAIEEILQNMQKEFPYTKSDIITSSKKLAPFEIGLEIMISFSSGVATALVVKFLERFWEEMKRNNILVETKGLDAIQKKAEDYLNQIGATDLEILRREDKGHHVVFIFKDKKKRQHFLRITSFDLRIIEYAKR